MTRNSLPLDQVQVGCLLGEDLLDASGFVLMACGTVLDATAIDRLRRRGVATVVLAVVPDPGRQEALRAILERELQPRFRHAGKNEASRLLYQAAIDYFMEKRI